MPKRVEIEGLEEMETFNRVMMNAQKKYKAIEELIDIKNKETQDLLHQVEINKMTEKEKREWYKAMKKCRQERRNLKNDLEVMTIFKELLEVPNLQHKIQTAICNLKRIKNNREKPIYYPRAIKDLEIRQEDAE